MWLAALAFLYAVASSPMRVDEQSVVSESSNPLSALTSHLSPIYPPPSHLWKPQSGDVPSDCNFVFLQSDPGDYIGQGLDYTYTQRNSTISVNLAGDLLSVSVNGNDQWTGNFQAANSSTNMQRGYYGNLTRYPFSDPSVGGLSWYGDGRGCNTLSGWFVVDQISHINNSLATITLRFEQLCEGNGPALHGMLVWNISDPVSPTGPVYPPPSDLWKPAQGTVPRDGNFVYLESDAGDWVGGGQNYTYTPANTSISITLRGDFLSVNINGDDQWSGQFQGMNSISNMQTGYYGNLTRYPFNNPTTGGLSWYGNGRGCNTLTGWFVIDEITSINTTLATVSLRFEQHCEGGVPALHGEIKWNTSQPITPPGPVYPPPSRLWKPAHGVTPKGSNFVYLESDLGDWVGGGQNYSYTPKDASISVSLYGTHLSVSINGNDQWTGDFVAMSSIDDLEPGYYGDLKRYPFNNPVKGGLSWSGDGRGCNTLTGWFVVDNVTYSNDTLEAVTLRFEQHCEGGKSALHGMVKWNTSHPITPPGPVYPPPSNLWKPLREAIPNSKTFIYLESDPGDYIGGGLNYSYTPANNTISVTMYSDHLSVSVNGIDQWNGDFQGMSSLTELKRGYYGDLMRYPFNNPVKGGLSWYGNGRGCNTLTGWFVVDAIKYSNTTFEAISLRFEQHCEGGTPALHGMIQWNMSHPKPSGPVSPPSDLWKPDFLPISDTFVYLDSEEGDPVGKGQRQMFTKTNATISLISGDRLSVFVETNDYWVGSFQHMNTVSKFEIGFYDDLSIIYSALPDAGGMDWSGNRYACESITGWFVIDSISFEADVINAITLRFSQHCEGRSAALHGMINWNSAEAIVSDI